MKRILLLLPVLLFPACITITMAPKPEAVIAPTAAAPGGGIAMKPSAESVNFVDPSDGLTYKWVKVRVSSYPYLYPSVTSSISGSSLSPISSAAPRVVIGEPAATSISATPASKMREVPRMDTFRDDRDGHVYKTVSIGRQMWMAENLNYKMEKGSKYYNDDPKTGVTYGMLYNFNSLTEACPKGWHIPTDAEWQQLEYNAGLTKEEASAERFRGTVSTNFFEGGATNMNIKFAGYYGRSKFTGQGDAAYFFTSTRENTPITVRHFVKGDNRIGKSLLGEGYWLSVRCVKD